MEDGGGSSESLAGQIVTELTDWTTRRRGMALTASAFFARDRVAYITTYQTELSHEAY